MILACALISNDFCLLYEQLQQSIEDLRNRLTSSRLETDSLRTELQLALVSVDAERRYRDPGLLEFKIKPWGVIYIQCPPLILAPQRRLWKYICIVYLSFKHFHPIIEVKQLKVGEISLWNKCFLLFMLATNIGTQLLQRPFPRVTALSCLL